MVTMIRFMAYVLMATIAITAGVIAVWLVAVYGFIAWSGYRLWKERSA